MATCACSVCFLARTTGKMDCPTYRVAQTLPRLCPDTVMNLTVWRMFQRKFTSVGYAVHLVAHMLTRIKTQEQWVPASTYRSLNSSVAVLVAQAKVRVGGRYCDDDLHYARCDCNARRTIQDERSATSRLVHFRMTTQGIAARAIKP